MAKYRYAIEPSGHFFASSIADWATSEDLEKLIKEMKGRGFTFTVYHVPVPAATDYRISEYKPVVAGCTLLAKYIVR